MPERKRIALMAPNWLGDAVMSLPLAGMLHAAGARVSVLASPYVARVYAGLSDVDELIVDVAGGRMRRMIARMRALDASTPHAAVICPPSFSSALTALFAAVRFRVGLATDARSPLLTDVLPSLGSRQEHLSLNYRRLGERALERVGLVVPDQWRAPAMWVGDQDRADAEAALREAGVPDGGYAVVVPGATYGTAKTWPSERFEQLCERVSADIPVVLTGARRERDLCERVCAGRSNVFNLAGETSLGGFFGLLAGASVVIANDSGSPHAAAALGAPVVVLFGSTSPVWTAPLGDYVEVVQHRVPCNPCFLKTCPTQLECFAGISSEEVHGRVRAVLEAAPNLPKKGSQA